MKQDKNLAIAMLRLRLVSVINTMILSSRPVSLQYWQAIASSKLHLKLRQELYRCLAVYHHHLIFSNLPLNVGNLSEFLYHQKHQLILRKPSLLLEGWNGLQLNGQICLNSVHLPLLEGVEQKIFTSVHKKWDKWIISWEIQSFSKWASPLLVCDVLIYVYCW